MKPSKLGLGTAQLGMNYGINNISGQPSFNQCKTIIKKAVLGGINIFDTAPEYGTSEEILGKCLEKFDKKKILFVSKVPPTDWTKDSKTIIKNLNKALQKTLKNLGIKKLPIYLFHRFSDIKKRDFLILKELKSLKDKGLVGEIGVSIYTPKEARDSLEIDGIQVIQVPFNLIDKRLLDNGFLKKAKQKGVTLMARSVFLQGLFLKKEIPDNLAEFKPYQQKIKTICQEEKMDIAELALRYPLSISQIDTCLVGVEKEEQLIKNLRIFKKRKLPKRIIQKINKLGTAPEKIINPSLWNLK